MFTGKLVNLENDTVILAFEDMEEYELQEAITNLLEDTEITCKLVIDCLELESFETEDLEFYISKGDLSYFDEIFEALDNLTETEKEVLVLVADNNHVNDLHEMFCEKDINDIRYMKDVSTLGELARKHFEEGASLIHIPDELENCIDWEAVGDRYYSEWYFEGDLGMAICEN